MKYGWNREELEEKLEFSRANDSIANRQKRIIYGRMLYDLDGTSSFSDVKIGKEYFLKQLEEFDESYFDESYFKLLQYMSKYIYDFDMDFEIKNTEKKNPTEIIKTCKDFYKKNDKESLVYFKRIVKQENRIHFIKNNSLNPFIGRSYIIDNSDYYILINGRNYLEDMKALIHEGKHVEMAIKGYDISGITLYQELASILYEMYMLDYLERTDDNKQDVRILRMSNLNKYIRRINKYIFQIELIKKLKEDKDFYENINANYDLYYDEYNLRDIFRVLKNGYSEKEIGIIISFIVALDIYLNSNMSNVNNVLSCYIFGIYKMKPSIMDNILEYITSMYTPYMQEGQKMKKKYKNAIDKL